MASIQSTGISILKNNDIDKPFYGPTLILPKKSKRFVLKKKYSVSYSLLFSFFNTDTEKF